MRLDEMKFSLIMSTCGRTFEVERFLSSLNAQMYRNLELIIVDQNGDDRLVPLVKAYQNSFAMIHLRSEKGASMAKNLGLKYADGDLIGFPDDDCWYPPDLLRRVSDTLANIPRYDGLSVRSVTEKGQSFFGHRRMVRDAGFLDPYNIWIRLTNYTLFVRRQVTAVVTNFDEQLGPGTQNIYHAGDDTEYALRIIKAGFKIYYDPEIIVHHPDGQSIYSEAVIKKAYFYGCSVGKVLLMNDYPLWYKCKMLIRPLGGTALSALTMNFKKSRFHWNIFRGRLRGMMPVN